MAPSGKRTLPILIGSLVFALVLTLLAIGNGFLHPTFTGGTFKIGDGEWAPFEAPLRFESEKALIEARMTMLLDIIRPRNFRVTVDDCLQELWINEERVEVEPFCDWNGKVLDLSASVRAGRNEVFAVLGNDGGPGFWKIETAFGDPLLLTLRCLLILAIGGYAVFLFWMFRGSRVQVTVLAAFIAGTVLRLFYLFITPFTVRGHDPEGHVEYLIYIAKNLRLPEPTAGWEYYQPPLYYLISGLWVRLGFLFARTEDALLRDIQVQAFFLSLIVMMAVFWTGSMLFPGKQNARERTMFAWLFALFPGYLYFAARINNDVLLAFWMFLAFAFLMLWWERGKSWQWLLSVTFSALGMLTKSNAILFLPVLGICLLLRKGTKMKTKLLLGNLGLVIVLALNGWTLVTRYGLNDSHPIVANLSNLNSALAVSDAPETLTEFNPLRIILHPFNNAWDDAAGRQNFWEYFFKSAFFGEFGYAQPWMTALASVILFVALLLLPFAAYGAWRAIRWETRRTLPLWLTAIVLLAGHAAYRQSAPFSSSQDFRYSILVVVPMLFFLVSAWKVLRKPYRIGITTLLIALPVLSAAFIISLATVP